MVSAPALKDRWWAEKGQGAFYNNQSIHVSDIQTLDKANGLHGSLFGSEACSTPEPVIELLQDTYRQRGFGDFYPHMLVAMGCGEYAIDFKLNVWDIAPLKIIVEGVVNAVILRVIILFTLEILYRQIHTFTQQCLIILKIEQFLDFFLNFY